MNATARESAGARPEASVTTPRPAKRTTMTGSVIDRNAPRNFPTRIPSRRTRRDNKSSSDPWTRSRAGDCVERDRDRDDGQEQWHQADRQEHEDGIRATREDGTAGFESANREGLILPAEREPHRVLARRDVDPEVSVRIRMAKEGVVQIDIRPSGGDSADSHDVQGEKGPRRNRRGESRFAPDKREGLVHQNAAKIYTPRALDGSLRWPD